MKKEKILLVDDEPDILEIVSYNLKKEDYNVFTADNGKDAIKIAKKEIFKRFLFFTTSKISFKVIAW
jgi:DNA-binding response OmpR family regulator